MYTILEKNNGIVKFLAESDYDLAKIIDVCKPGSTVEVLGEKTDGEESDGKAPESHTFIKSPSGEWVLYKGKSKVELPKNDAKVSAPSPEAIFYGSDKKIKDYQEGITIYQSGLVTGTLFNATVPDNVGYEENQRTGHYFTANLDTPEGAQHYDIYTEGQKRGESHDCDGILTVRMENMTAPTPTGKRIKVKYDTGQEFEFALDDLVLK